MKREIYNPFEASAKTEETMVSESLSIDSKGNGLSPQVAHLLVVCRVLKCQEFL
jgi:hypothetical protein